MKSRHRAREVALQYLYHLEVPQESTSAIKIQPVSSSSSTSQHWVKELPQHLIGYFEHFQVPEPIRSFASELIAGVLLKKNELDESIQTLASNWKLERMTPIDRNILRIGVYELKNTPNISVSVIIDEAVELAKAYSSAESSGFINGILDATAKAVRSSP